MAVYTMTAYPKQVALGTEGPTVIRPTIAGDEMALLEFFLRVPDEDCFYLKDDVTSPAVFRRWAEGLDYSRALPLLALVGSRIIADGMLHRRRSGARRHIGEIRIVVEPEHRHKGMATALMRELYHHRQRLRSGGADLRGSGGGASTGYRDRRGAGFRAARRAAQPCTRHPWQTA